MFQSTPATAGDVQADVAAVNAALVSIHARYGGRLSARASISNW